jgi:hypothetical protein
MSRNIVFIDPSYSSTGLCIASYAGSGKPANVRFELVKINADGKHSYDKYYSRSVVMSSDIAAAIFREPGYSVYDVVYEIPPQTAMMAAPLWGLSFGIASWLLSDSRVGSIEYVYPNSVSLFSKKHGIKKNRERYILAGKFLNELRNKYPDIVIQNEELVMSKSQDDVATAFLFWVMYTLKDEPGGTKFYTLGRKYG